MSHSNLKNLLPADTKITLTAPSGSSSKKAILKQDNETPWTSQSLPSSVHLQFPTPISDATHVALTFQGGFVGTTAFVYIATKPANEGEVEVGLMMAGKIYPEDKNKRQVFEIPFPANTSIPSAETQEAIDSQPNRALSPVGGEPGPNITTIVPPNPDGGGAKADPIVPGAEDIHKSGDKAWTTPLLKEIKLEFEASSDQFGRITLYSIEILG